LLRRFPPNGVADPLRILACALRPVCCVERKIFLPNSKRGNFLNLSVFLFAVKNKSVKMLLIIFQNWLSLDQAEHCSVLGAVGSKAELEVK